MKLVLTIIISLGVSHVCLSQNTPRIVNEQERPNCETLLVGVDLLGMALLDQPDSRAAIVISGPNSQLVGQIEYEQLVRGALAGRRADVSSRVDIIRGAATEALLLRYWIVPKSASIDKVDSWDLRLPELNEPLMLRSDMAQICEPPPIEKVAKDLLDSNPNGSLFVVVHGRTFQERRRELRLAKKMLKGFDPARVRYLLRHSGSGYSDYYFAVGNPPRTTFKSNF